MNKIMTVPGTAPCEAHITVEPRDFSNVDDAFWIAYGDFVARSLELGWRASKFDHDDVDGIAGKWFLTRNGPRGDIGQELIGMVHGLECSGFTVLRSKIELVLFDTKVGHELDSLS